jgi:hypothetical protein
MSTSLFVGLALVAAPAPKEPPPTICRVPLGERPKAFESAPGSTTMLLILKRAKKD